MMARFRGHLPLAARLALDPPPLRVVAVPNTSG